MKPIYLKIALLLVLGIVSIKNYAQTVDDVTLVVSSDGMTKEEATKNALRSAIEQAYGTFVSANTKILDDELVKDEIVTIANGNIKKYSEISSEKMPDGRQFVTLQVAVSVSKLIKYAQSKGSETEFAGATFGMNLKMREMNAKNEVKVMDNLFEQLRLLAPTMYDYELKVSEPVMRGNSVAIDMTIRVLSNKNTKVFCNLIVNTLKTMAMTPKMAEANLQYGLSTIGYNIYLINAPTDLRKYVCDLYKVQSPIGSHQSTEQVYYFHNPFRAKEFTDMIKEALYSFTIKDNTGKVYPVEISLPKSKSAYIPEYMVRSSGAVGPSTGMVKVYIKNDYDYEGSCFGVEQGLRRAEGSNCHGQLVFQCDNPGVLQYEIEHTILVPRESISNISKFEIVHNIGFSD